MKKIEVTIKEKDKGFKILSLLNLRDELVNFLYKDTVANATKADLQFFVLLFFITIKVSNKTLLEHIFDEAIPRFDKLNETFLNKKRRLHAREYQKLVKEHGLTEIFKNDIFFVLIEAVLNIEEIKTKFLSFARQNLEIGKAIEKIKSQYSKQLNVGLKTFQSSRIEDDRHDDNGNYHDLSKSVYRTVRMRNSRNFDLNLQKYTSVKEITSKSPIELTFLQHIDPQIIFDLWDKYHLAEYIQSTVPRAVIAIKSHVDFQVHLGDLVPAWLLWKWTSAQDRKEKVKAKQNFESSKLKSDTNKGIEELTNTLVKSVLHANEKLEKEIVESRAQIQELSSKGVVMQDKEAIKKLEERVERLENLSVSARIVDESNRP